MANRVNAFVSLLLMALLAGCSGSSTCKTNSDCAGNAAGSVCAAGACVACGGDTDCSKGTHCSASHVCVACVASTDCMAGFRCAANACVAGCDATSRCPSGQVCAAALGACVQCVDDGGCSGSTPRCDVTSNKCVACNTDDDCGAGQVCHQKACATGCTGAHPQCPSMQVCYVAAGACVACISDGDCKSASAPRCDTRSNSCVACLPQGDNCPQGQYCAVSTCVAGCRTDGDCPAGQICSQNACAVGCSSAHPQCPTGQVCNLAGGACVGCLSDGDCKSPGLSRCDTRANTCVACLPSSDNCPTGQYCNNDSCVAGCKADSDCAASGSASDGGVPAGDGGVGAGGQCDVARHACVPCVTDSACGLGFVCVNEACVAGCSAQHACSGAQGCCPTSSGANACVAVLTDVTNCGGCGAVCPTVPNGQPGCSGGSCTIGSCNAGFADCDQQRANGCEANIASDPTSCGACSRACAVPNAKPGCSGGKCTVASCNPLFGDCDGDPTNGCETPLTTLNNCKVCGTACTIASGTATCASGTCAVAACNANFADCNGAASDGCEVSLLSDPKNCGKCGNVCPSGKCTSGQCNVPVTFQESFLQSQSNPNACTDWNTFLSRIDPTATYTSVTMSSQFGSRTCTGAGANNPADQICKAMKALPSNFVIACNGNTWTVGGNCSTNDEVTADGITCSCTSGFVVRACNGGTAWGAVGSGSNSCSAPSQTITVTCQ